MAQINGNVLHDWHAEIVAVRAFNRWLLDSCLVLSAEASSSSVAAKASDRACLDASAWIRKRTTQERSDSSPQPFEIRSEVELYMYCSEAPCGDASMELVIAAQEDATPWATETSSATSSGPSIPSENTESTVLRGRGFFSELGTVRRKPSRPDAPPTLSKSCSDKLAQFQFLSLLSSTTSLIMHPGNAYLKALVLPSSQLVYEAVERAFGRSGRLAGLTHNESKSWQGGYCAKWFMIIPTDVEFEFSRRQDTSFRLIPSNITAVRTPHFQQTLIGGTLQGRKQLDPLGSSKICRRAVLQVLFEVAFLAGVMPIRELLKSCQYREIKSNRCLESRNKVKEDVRRVLTPEGWTKNTGDEAWKLIDAAES